MAEVIQIYIAGDKGLPMHPVERIRAIAGEGLEGDRYALNLGSWKKPGAERHSPYRQTTLIAIEAIAAANEAQFHPTGEKDRRTTHRYMPNETRRNIVTFGIEVNDLVGHEFMIGTARFRAHNLSEPCDRPDKLSGKTGFEAAFQNRAGINCEIIESGEIAVRDKIMVCA